MQPAVDWALPFPTLRLPEIPYWLIKLKSVVYTSMYYDKNVRRANSFVQFKSINGEIAFGEILHFIKDLFSQEIFALINLFKIDHINLFFLEESLYKVKHLLPVVDSGKIIIVPVSNLITKLIKATQYICLRPNPYEVNL
ncbi:hypothetical protein KUF71_014648 [Frankliniella fusca]|uniref:Uncharacterized protein n=1 Tax=Frankliniella fusca TaxID=407009 RepID=A0AAE1HTA6_9NEOP|nr:hypothetical protein KUF71_014648 [Frankliniella fusca]